MARSRGQPVYRENPVRVGQRKGSRGRSTSVLRPQPPNVLYGALGETVFPFPKLLLYGVLNVGLGFSRSPGSVTRTAKMAYSVFFGFTAFDTQ